MNFAQKAREMAEQAKQEQEKQRLAKKEAEKRSAAEKHRKKLEEIEAIAARLTDIVTAEAKGGAHKAFIHGGIPPNERELWAPIEKRCRELGIRYHMKKNHHPSCNRHFFFVCSSLCGDNYHLEVSW
jgi:hypothetical protein